MEKYICKEEYASCCNNEVQTDPESGEPEVFCPEHLWCEKCGSKLKLSRQVESNEFLGRSYANGKCYNPNCIWFNQ